MSESKITFHAPVARDPSAAREIIPVPPASMQVVPARSDPRRRQRGRTRNERPVRTPCPAAMVEDCLARRAASGSDCGCRRVLAVCTAIRGLGPAGDQRTPTVHRLRAQRSASTAYFRTQMEIIRSRWILGRAVANEKIKQMPEIRKQQDPIEWLKKWVKVVSANGSDVFEIKYSCANPENAALVVNEITKQYLTAQEEEEAKRRPRHRCRPDSGNAIPGKGRPHAADPSADGDTTGFRQGTGTYAARSELPGEEPAGRTAKPADHASGRARDAQCADRASEEELRVAEEAEKASTMQTAAKKAAQSDAATKVAAARSKRKLTAEEEEWRDLTVEREIATNAEVRQLESQLLANKMELERIEKLFRARYGGFLVHQVQGGNRDP